mmetsp:Transcript_5226/g.10747  ORF Transcript_5226/g.10747 Transcript_5226/m.10747 type:complete len:221 (-) Transcript_5226:14-676(-)
MVKSRDLFGEGAHAADGIEIRLVLRIRHQPASITARRHVLEEVLHSAKKAFVVVRVSVNTAGDVLEAVVVELAQEGGETIVAKVLLQHSGLFKSLGDRNLEAAAMRKPLNTLRVLLVTENVVHLFAEGHVFNLCRSTVLHVGRYDGEVTIRMIDIALWFLYNLYRSRFYRKNIFDLSVSLLALLLRRGCIFRSHGGIEDSRPFCLLRKKEEQRKRAARIL